jgi:hypothetical protein
MLSLAIEGDEGVEQVPEVADEVLGIADAEDGGEQRIGDRTMLRSP